VVPFVQGLRAEGYVEGQNVAIQYRWADGQYDRLPAFAAEFVRQRVHVIAAQTSAAAMAAKPATDTIPTVFVTGSDPVRLGLVASINRPGGNRTGMNLVTHTLDAKRLELIRELIPTATTRGSVESKQSEPRVQQHRCADGSAHAWPANTYFERHERK
jgi:putative ABC transport system substrate-binding protein